MRYLVIGNITILLSTEVEAESEEEAKEIALDRPIMSLCHQCAHPDKDSEWGTSELDGEQPEIVDVEEL